MMGINTKSKLTHNLLVSFVSSLRTPGKLLVFTVACHKIGIDKYIKIGSENKLKKFYLKDIVYDGGFHFFVSCVVGKDNTV
jgi:hypothetical protein